MKIKAAVLRESNKPLTIEELELEPPKEKEVLVKYRYTGFDEVPFTNNPSYPVAFKATAKIPPTLESPHPPVMGDLPTT